MSDLCLSEAEFKDRLVERERELIARLHKEWKAQRPDQDTSEYAAQIALAVLAVAIEIVYEDPS
jgi:hypothetical protein